MIHPIMELLCQSRACQTHGSPRKQNCSGPSANVGRQEAETRYLVRESWSHSMSRMHPTEGYSEAAIKAAWPQTESRSLED